MTFVLAIDAGTTGVRALLVDASGQVAGLAYRELAVSCPRPGWVEMDPLAIADGALDVAARCLAGAGLTAADLAAVGIVNQRATTIVWERATLQPVCPAIVWQDSRTADRVRELVAAGVPANSMASLTKLEWILANLPAGAGGDLCFGTVDTWLAARLSAGALHVTDSSNASCTGLYDAFRDRWNPKLLDLLAIPEAMLPRVVASSAVVGATSAAVFGAEVPIAGMAGDQQAAMFGELGFRKGAIKATIGTSAMVDVHLGGTPVLSTRGAFPLVLWKRNGELAWCLEGTVVTAGASVQWLRDGLGILASVEESSAVAASVPDSGGVWALPALQGTGTPHMEAKARARLGGMSRSTTRAHVVRAVLEGVAWRLREVVDTLVEDSGVAQPERLRVDGGAAANDFLLQQIADATGIAVERPACVQASAVGGAYLAGLAAGVWRDESDLGASWKSGGVFVPQVAADEREQRFRQWQVAASSCREEIGA